MSRHLQQMSITKLLPIESLVRSFNSVTLNKEFAIVDDFLKDKKRHQCQF